MIGRMLGPYRILEKLGEGGMGEVYRAEDTRLGRAVAIKVLQQDAAVDPQRRRRFEQEARAVSSLNHPHICVLHDIGREGDIDYLVMELLEGESLARRLDRGPLSLAEALQTGIQVAEALAVAHAQGIVHRDLKPANIMLTRLGPGRQGATHAKLLDFGLAKLRPPSPASAALHGAETTSPPSVTLPGTVLGTLPYMAPEQLEGQEADARSDLFSFGAVLYEMLTGRRAFDGRSAASVMAAVLMTEPPALGTLVPLTPATLQQVVERCLAKDRGRRWGSAQDLAEELRWIADHPSGTHAPARPTSDTRPAPPPSGGVSAWIAVLALVALTLLMVWRRWVNLVPVTSLPVALAEGAPLVLLLPAGVLVVALGLNYAARGWRWRGVATLDALFSPGSGGGRWRIAGAALAGAALLAGWWLAPSPVQIALVPGDLPNDPPRLFRAYVNVNTGYVLQEASHYLVTLNTGSRNPAGRYSLTIRLRRYGSEDGVEFGHIALDRRLGHDLPLGEPKFDDRTATGSYTIAGPLSDFAGPRVVRFDITYHRSVSPGENAVEVSLQANGYPPVTRSHRVDPQTWPRR